VVITKAINNDFHQRRPKPMMKGVWNRGDEFSVVVLVYYVQKKKRINGNSKKTSQGRDYVFMGSMAYSFSWTHKTIYISVYILAKHKTNQTTYCKTQHECDNDPYWALLSLCPIAIFISRFRLGWALGGRTRHTIVLIARREMHRYDKTLREN
jgi:hypothetical protein